MEVRHLAPVVTTQRVRGRVLFDARLFRCRVR